VHRFYLPEAEPSQRELSLAGAEAHHAVDVLRLQPGDELTVLNGRGAEFLCQITGGRPNTIRLTVVKQHVAEPPAAKLTLLQALPKIFDSLVQKATELGVHRIVPLQAARSVPDLAKKDVSKKLEKWRTVAIESIKQCGAPWLPKIEPPVAPSEFLNSREKFELSLIASLRPGSKYPRVCFDDFRARHGRSPESICVWVGPEGDFTEEEYDAIEAGGALPMTLGRNVLRVETAATYCLSVVSYELQAYRGA